MDNTSPEQVRQDTDKWTPAAAIDVLVDINMKKKMEKKGEKAKLTLKLQCWRDHHALQAKHCVDRAYPSLRCLFQTDTWSILCQTQAKICAAFDQHCPSPLARAVSAASATKPLTESTAPPALSAALSAACCTPSPAHRTQQCVLVIQRSHKDIVKAKPR
jgi:hypothetical protein